MGMRRVLAVILRTCLHIVRDVVKLGMYLINIFSTSVQTGNLRPPKAQSPQKLWKTKYLLMPLA